ncbi:hypothetical protein DOTSEDRAFT_32729 [Dothistroma septosporum NZE10]|uniref:Uncharacterized protein n=1 Tax=Dothistroma septosporum (strain NZE10 / CBS 128990) TaxID=675120 RepID=N1PUJ3_DOTSN|nr:hypothetical protein DOTSEDRAFT_32729 [Dothistroma septosporum NZE10]
MGCGNCNSRGCIDVNVTYICSGHRGRRRNDAWPSWCDAEDRPEGEPCTSCDIFTARGVCDRYRKLHMASAILSARTDKSTGRIAPATSRGEKIGSTSCLTNDWQARDIRSEAPKIPRLILEQSRTCLQYERSVETNKRKIEAYEKYRPPAKKRQQQATLAQSIYQQQRYTFQLPPPGQCQQGGQQ